MKIKRQNSFEGCGQEYQQVCVELVCNAAGRWPENGGQPAPETACYAKLPPALSAPQAQSEEEQLRRQVEEKGQEICRLKERLAVLERAKEELAAREDAARAERARLLGQARAKADEAYACRLAEGEREKEKILQAAREACGKMREEAQRDCAARRAAAERQGLEDARRAAALLLAAEQADCGGGNGSGGAGAPLQLLQQAKELDALRDEMLERSSSIQRRMARQMDEIQQQMEQQLLAAGQALLGMKHGMEDELVSWRRSFFRTKYLGLASCYAALYRQTGPDSRISQMIGRLALRLGAAGRDEEEGQGAEPDVKMLQDLQALYKNMVALQRSLEKAMAQLGLYVEVPQEGTPFADEWHVMEVEADQAVEGTPIEACITPAVGVYGGEGQGGECILRAAVTVKRRP